MISDIVRSWLLKIMPFAFHRVQVGIDDIHSILFLKDKIINFIGKDKATTLICNHKKHYLHEALIKWATSIKPFTIMKPPIMNIIQTRVISKICLFKPGFSYPQ